MEENAATAHMQGVTKMGRVDAVVIDYKFTLFWHLVLSPSSFLVIITEIRLFEGTSGDFTR